MAFASLAFIGAQAAHAQLAPGTAPSQIAPPSARPEPPVMQSPPRVESAPSQPVPAGAERVFFTPGSFLVDGEYP
jgi:hypothetical protein